MKIKDYFSLKAPVYSGKHQKKDTVIKHFHYNESGITESSGFERKPGFKSYIQVIGLDDISKIEPVKTILKIDSLIFKDIFNVTQRIKMDIKPTYIFSVLHGLFHQENHYKKEYMSMLYGEDVVISFHEEDPWYLEPCIQALETYKDLRMKTSDFLFYQILDLITDNHIESFDLLNIALSQFEDVILNEDTLPQEEFYLVRKSFLKLKTYVYNLLEQLGRLIAKPDVMINQENIEYFHDLIDHLNRLDAQVNLARENIRNLVDVNINNQSNKMNRIMTTLTLFSATFIPLSFLTGFFGMNFVHFEILQYKYSVILFIVFCVLLFAFMLWYFKRKKWL